MITEIQEHEFNTLKNYLLVSSGIDVPVEKKYLFTTRLSEFLIKVKCSSFLQLHELLQNDPLLHQSFIESMTTHETSFFRDGHPYQVFQNTILPEIVKKRGTSTRKMYIWSVACSTGQEPYSLSIAIHEWCQSNPQSGIQPADFVIFAGDISERVLSVARRGVYTRDEVARGITDIQLSKYFKQIENCYEVNQNVREIIQFRQINLSQPLVYMGRFDLIMCRNVMIYFSVELRKKIVGQFSDVLQSEGFLILGASETLYGLSENFLPHHYGETIVYRTPK
jgi:chemotaxis protein methyltransferase CheR